MIDSRSTTGKEANAIEKNPAVTRRTIVTSVGAEGELVVHGSTVADGYWNDPDRTAGGFGGKYTYRTGDIVQILDDSPPSYRFVGRRDHLICAVRGEATGDELRRACRERLPSYMVPDHVVIVGTLPRTANDKYDRTQLARRAAALIGG
jgi:L-proline---[L-prolyl-carrier protein] ligase